MGQTRGVRGRFGKGCALAEGLLYGLIILVLAFSGYAVFHSVETRQRIAVVFKDWYEDKPGHDRALAEQKTTRRPVLVYIYAPWCPHCQQFNANILSNPTVRQAITQYPHVRIAPDHGPGERQLMARYGAEGYPAFYVVMPDGGTRRVETFLTAPVVRPKTPTEFIRSLQITTGGQ
jgi:thiol:disulfide interchange protein